MSAGSLIEEGTDIHLDFSKLKKAIENSGDIIPAVAQEEKTKEILMLGYVNRESLDYALENKVATFWSTSRNELWVKGKTSGEYLDLVETRVNCEQNSILYIVRLRSSGACHTKEKNGHFRLSCYYRKINQSKLEFC
ncbi:MAG: phosphoribosyl-AMP cyclohydrolase [Leptospirales bacterium]